MTGDGGRHGTGEGGRGREENGRGLKDKGKERARRWRRGFGSPKKFGVALHVPPLTVFLHSSLH